MTLTHACDKALYASFLFTDPGPSVRLRGCALDVGWIFNESLECEALLAAFVEVPQSYRCPNACAQPACMQSPHCKGRGKISFCSWLQVHPNANEPLPMQCSLCRMLAGCIHWSTEDIGPFNVQSKHKISCTYCADMSATSELPGDQAQHSDVQRQQQRV